MLHASHGAEGIGMVNKRFDVRVLIAEAISSLGAAVSRRDDPSPNYT
jgi:hypothetical protein